ncbi:MAG: M48 family metallopeptidase [Oscillatoria sp. PMC 1051.18]|uniref:M48 family metallopeptidase n=1 Tax=Oscillatoria salina TaxID=331517 RepID=UPI0013BC7137|nr:M48 family metallopeptidase [Oscillatoria salina]MBZ8181413.1 M48 family metalloprotease [Oscillatoria salina IIICB1]MEC4893425.1 M48 family metallopeptidase [Oscillatoria sp. PMC 1050.18]MEC5030205.1 M48 family metallopeptidase [Oscillatoria sp. PMC 1051.18]NET88719.1 M48 family metalloprotease [Kamptonema sp. SIO1D9]
MLKQFSAFVWRRQQRRWLYGLLSVVTALSLWLGTPQPSQAISWIELLLRGVQIYQISNLSPRQEVQLGKQINQQLIESGRVELVSDRQINEYINQIGQRLAQYSDRPELPYTFQVVKDDSINAFATMGGFVYIHTGLIKAADNEAELASVVAHEIAHISRRHSVEQLRQRALAEGVLSAAGLEQSRAVQIGVELAYSRPNSRQDELEADQSGLEMLRQAGYAPSATIAFLEKLQRQGGSPPAFLSTHPATSDRIRALEREIDPAMANQGEGLNNQAYQAKIRSLL